jgi:hypothetical protein
MSQSTLRRSTWWLAAIVGPIILLLLIPARSHAEDNPNNYQCFGHVLAGQTEAGASDQQVAYTFNCSGPISGYQIQTQIPLTGFDASPLITNEKGEALTTDSFSCNGEFPGYAINCVGGSRAGYETIAAQFTIGSQLCTEPRVDPLLTVTYAYLNEKKVITQAISGPFDLGRPRGCPASSEGGHTRLTYEPVVNAKKAGGKRHGKKRGHGRKPGAHRSKKTAGKEKQGAKR